jgi:hypothetical protein
MEIMRMQAGEPLLLTSWPAMTRLRSRRKRLCAIGQNYVTGIRILATSNALAGRLEEARHAMARLCRIDPTSRVSNSQGAFSSLPPEHFNIWTKGHSAEHGERTDKPASKLGVFRDSVLSEVSTMEWLIRNPST